MNKSYKSSLVIVKGFYILFLMSIILLSAILYAEATSFFPSPLKQFKSGIETKYVKCQPGFQLIVKKQDFSPACVKPDTAKRLMLQDWIDLQNLSTAGIKLQAVLLGPFGCGTGLSTKISIVNSSGFEVYNFAGINDYVLSPTKQGAMSYKIDNIFHGSPVPKSFQRSQNITNSATFYHQSVMMLEQNITRQDSFRNGQIVSSFTACYAMPNEEHTLICTRSSDPPSKQVTIPVMMSSNIAAVSFEPPSEILKFNSSALVGIKISSYSNGTEGTYSLTFAPGPCVSPPMLITIGTKPFQ